MNISLRPVTAENFRECLELDPVSSHVASNMYSLAEAYVNKALTPLAIYNDADQMVGFTMYGVDADGDIPPGDKIMLIYRLMIDKQHQGQGYGGEALRRVIKMIGLANEYKEIYISTSPKNTGAARLYQRLGFVKTPYFFGDEEVFCKKLDDETEVHNG